MKETRTINLNGLVYHVDYDAYQLLRDYLQDVELRLPIDKKNDIIEEVEARIAELFQKTLFAKKEQIVGIQLVQSVIKQIGEPSDFGPNRRVNIKVNKSQHHGGARVFRIVLNVLLAVLALPVIVIGFVVLFAIIVSLVSVAIAGTTSLAAILPVIPVFAELLVEGGAVLIPLLIIALILIVVLPIVMIVHTLITYLRTRRGPKAHFWWISIILWVVAVLFWGASIVHLYRSIDNAPQIMKTMTINGLSMDEDGMLTSALQLDVYHSVELRGAAELHLSNAQQSSTVLTTNLISPLATGAELKAEVRDSVLYIETPNHIPLEAMMVDFTIASPCLRTITIYGASKIETLDGQILTQPTLTLNLNGATHADLQLNVQTLTIDAKGASKLELEGMAKDVHVTIAGASELDAEDLVAQVMHVNCAGASKAEVNVVRELWAQAAGASKITYKGTPTIKQGIAVGESVIKKN